MNKEEIKKILPHRDNMLLLDEVVREEKKEAISEKDKNEVTELYENCEDGANMVCDDHIEIWDYNESTGWAD